MKRFKKDISAWIVICLFFIAIFILYNKLEYNLTEDEPAAEISDITELHPVVADKTEELIELAADRHIVVVITDTVRTMAEQEALYDQGRAAEGNIVTNAQPGESFHNYGLAVDFAVENKEGDVIWDTSYDGNNNGKPDWVEVADIAKELGFEWGGDWNGFKDYPHLQMTFGHSLRQLQNGVIPE